MDGGTQSPETNASSSSSSEIVMIDETKGENEKDVSFKQTYSLRTQDCPHEMERNEATANPVAWPSCAWLQLSFSPFPVGHPMSAGCRHSYH